MLLIRYDDSVYYYSEISGKKSHLVRVGNFAAASRCPLPFRDSVSDRRLCEAGYGFRCLVVPQGFGEGKEALCFITLLASLL